MVTQKYARFSYSIWNYSYTNWAALGLSLRHICILLLLINSKDWGPQVVWNMIKYAITDRGIERPSTKEKRPHFLLQQLFAENYKYICVYFSRISLFALQAPSPVFCLIYTINNIKFVFILVYIPFLSLFVIMI